MTTAVVWFRRDLRVHDQPGAPDRRLLPDQGTCSSIGGRGDVPVARLYEPWQMTDGKQREARCRIGREYLEPVVDHAEAGKLALAGYGAARTNSGG